MLGRRARIVRTTAAAVGAKWSQCRAPKEGDLRWSACGWFWQRSVVYGAHRTCPSRSHAILLTTCGTGPATMVRNDL
jgi:hypothetical protein